MANPTVDKLKALGLRHGEKAVVGLAVTLFLLFVVMAITKKTIEMKPEELAEKAKSADSNLGKTQKTDDILASIEKAGIKPATEFEQTVEKSQSKALNPAEYVVKSKWVTPEPGAGLIRDQPELIAVENLYAFPNRGGYLVYELDKNGERIPDDGKSVAKPRPARLGKPKNRKRGAGGMMGGSSSSMMASMMGGKGASRGKKTSEKKSKEDAEAQRKLDEARLKKSFVGKAEDKGEEKEKEKGAAETAVTAKYKETVKGYRSVVLTGTLDNKQLNENYLAALKDPAIAHPNYKQLDVQRQTLLPDGKWSEFALVDSDANHLVIDNLPEYDEELIPEAPGPLLEALVDHLPFPWAGYWSGVHVASLVPKDKREIAKPLETAGMGSYPGAGGGMSMSMPAMTGMQGGGSGQMSKGMNMSMMMAPGMSGGSGGYSGGMAGGAAGSNGPADETDFEKSESDEVMIRSIDFTVEADTTYRYRARVVVVNPNHLRNDVSPGTDSESPELKGPWSEPTDAVSVPPDVAAYAIKTAPASRRNDQVTYQVVRWNPKDGHTVVHNDEAGPGELIGNPATAQIPNDDGKGTKSELVDFNSHRFVLDTMGGTLPLPSVLKAGPSFPVPALSLVIRPDGAVAIHSQARDAIDEVRIEVDKNYKYEIDESNKKHDAPASGFPGLGGSR